MTILVGYTPDESGTAALHLAVMLARSAGAPLLVCSIVVVAVPPSPERMDTEYRTVLTKAAERSTEQARTRLPADVAAEIVVHSARSAPAGLLELAVTHAAQLVVLGSSSGGALGAVTLGSVTDRILHSAHLPVAVAPRGFRIEPDARVRRVTAAFGGSGSGPELVRAAAAVSARWGATLRVASFNVSPRTAFAGSIESQAEQLVVNEWVQAAAASMTDELVAVRNLPEVPQTLETVLGHGYSWREALADIPWGDGDLLTVGSSGTGPAARVFLGSRASKILRHSPVPVVLVPREALPDV